MALCRKLPKSFMLRLALFAPFVWFGIAIGLLFHMRRDMIFRASSEPKENRGYVTSDSEENGNPGKYPVRDLEYFYRPELAVGDFEEEDHEAAIDGEKPNELGERRANGNDPKLSLFEDGAGDYENGVERGAFDRQNRKHTRRSTIRRYLRTKVVSHIPGRGASRKYRRRDETSSADEPSTRTDARSEESHADDGDDYTYGSEYQDESEDYEYRSADVGSEHESARISRLIRVYDKNETKHLNISWPRVPLSGLGEGGLEVKLEPRNSAERKEKEEGLARHHFNQFVSDRISVIRNLKDNRMSECKNLTYRKNLPTTSVIIVFHNEAWTTLLRTVYSVLNRTPPHLLKEIILVDDFSDLEFLKLPLDAYMAWFEKIKVVHTIRREGLIQARLIGVELATGETLTFLDSHCECNIGWMEPLLDRVADDWSHVVTPIIDTIDEESFSYRTSGRSYFAIGSFSWSMSFKWGRLTKAERENRTNDTAPARSPTMAGGLFTINKEYFRHIGLYDPGMEIWGGENLELSFRIWMCGGTLEVIPCSRVGHVFRKINPNLATVKGSPHKKNTLRLVETWLDEYKYLYYQTTGTYPKKYSVGDIRERLELKKKLNCKPFSWYLANIVPEMFDPKTALRSGLLQNEFRIRNHDYKCLAQDVSSKSPLGNRLTIQTCNDNNLQIFYLTEDYGLRQLEHCLEYIDYKKEVFLKACRKEKEKHVWAFTEINQIKNIKSAKCLTMSIDGKQLFMEECINISLQIWKWIDYTRVNT